MTQSSSITTRLNVLRSRKFSIFLECSVCGLYSHVTIKQDADGIVSYESVNQQFEHLVPPRYARFNPFVGVTEKGNVTIFCGCCPRKEETPSRIADGISSTPKSSEIHLPTHGADILIESKGITQGCLYSDPHGLCVLELGHFPATPHKTQQGEI